MKPKTINNLLRACINFEKLAQKQIILDPNKKNIDFYSKFLYSAILSITNLIPNTEAAQKIFQSIATHRKAPGYGADKDLKQVETCLQALIESENKLRQYRIDPFKVLKTKMPNANPNVLNVLKSNLEILRDGKDFSKYQDYTAMLPDEILTQEQIEFPDTSGPGY